MSSCSKGRHTRSIPKPLSKITIGQFLQTYEVVTEPDAGVSITILPSKLEISRFNLLAQSKEIKECVAPVSIIAIKGMPLIKYVPLISRSSGLVSDPDNENTLPPACSFFALVHCGRVCPSSPQL